MPSASISASREPPVLGLGFDKLLPNLTARFSKTQQAPGRIQAEETLLSSMNLRSDIIRRNRSARPRGDGALEFRMSEGEEIRNVRDHIEDFAVAVYH